MNNDQRFMIFPFKITKTNTNPNTNTNANSDLWFSHSKSQTQTQILTQTQTTHMIETKWTQKKERKKKDREWGGLVETHGGSEVARGASDGQWWRASS